MGKVVIVTGAGVSAESGIPTFRSGSTALWENHSADEVCNIRTFNKNYDLVHRFYNARRVQLGTVKPNHAHMLIAKLQQEFGSDSVINITTNVDDLLERAGCKDVLHVHGELTKMVINYGSIDQEILDIGYGAWTPAPYESGIHDKPAVVFFGEIAPKYEEMYNILCDLTSDDVIVVIGASFQVVQFQHAFSSDVQSFNINPTDTSPRFTRNILKTATEGMTELYPILREKLLNETNLK